MTAKRTAPKPEPTPTKIAVQVAPSMGNYYTTMTISNAPAAPLDIIEAENWYTDARGELWLENKDGAEVKRYAAGHWYNVQFHRPS